MGLVQVAQHAEDLDRATAFYQELLGSAPRGRFDPPGLLFFDLDGVRLLLEPGAASVVHLSRGPSVRDAVERMRGGVDIVAEPHVIFRHEDDTLGPAGADAWQGSSATPRATSSAW